ncbi:diacylglycerol kinase [Croceimicrobium sp.]|uniref:diacylglycerol kinase n=1 Tax=Croceimicrobium sp. TaxID=2828340 RepID=UPI003BA97D06
MGYLKKRIIAFRVAFEGLGLLFREAAHARIHLLAVVLVSATAIYLNVDKTEWIALILCYGAVLSLEAVNSAIEYTLDLTHPENHPLAKKAKDIAAAAVLIAAICSVIIALIIFVPKF